MKVSQYHEEGARVANGETVIVEDKKQAQAIYSYTRTHYGLEDRTISQTRLDDGRYAVKLEGK